MATLRLQANLWPDYRGGCGHTNSIRLGHGTSLLGTVYYSYASGIIRDSRWHCLRCGKPKQQCFDCVGRDPVWIYIQGKAACSFDFQGKESYLFLIILRANWPMAKSSMHILDLVKLCITGRIWRYNTNCLLRLELNTLTTPAWAIHENPSSNIVCRAANCLYTGNINAE